MQSEAMVFRKGHVAVHGELRGQKWFSFIPPLVAPAITQLHRVMALGPVCGVAPYLVGRRG
jgi:hypothetical protein